MVISDGEIVYANALVRQIQLLPASIDQQVQPHSTTSKTSRQAGQRWTDRASGRRSAEKH